MTGEQHEVTKLLRKWSEGDQGALDELMPLVYDELRRMAHQHMRHEKPGHVLQTSALINEAYLRLVDDNGVHWESRSHFFGIAARVMRRILVDDARRRHVLKRGGAHIHVSLEAAFSASEEQAANLVALDEALKSLEIKDKRQARLLNCASSVA